MARSDSYDPAKLTAVGRQLGPFLSALEPSPAGPDSAPLGNVAESFQVWSVSVEDFKHTGAGKASWKRLWLHLIRQDAAAAHFYALSLDRGAPEVRAAYSSALAEKLSMVIERIDGDPNLQDDSYVVRVLEFPDADLTSVWVHNSIGVPPRVEDIYILLDPAKTVLEQSYEFISETDLKGRLPQPAEIGLSGSPPSQRRSDF